MPAAPAGAALPARVGGADGGSPARRRGRRRPCRRRAGDGVEAREDLVDRQQRRQRRHPEHAHLEHQLRIDRAQRRGERLVGLEEQAEEALQLVRRAPAGLRLQRGPLGLGQLGDERGVARRRQHGQVTDVLEQVATEALRVVAVLVERRQLAQARGGVTRQHRVDHGDDERAIGRPEQRAHRRLVGRALAGREHLLEQRLGVAQAALRLARHQRQRSLGQRDALLLHGTPQLGGAAQPSPMRRRS